MLLRALPSPASLLALLVLSTALLVGTADSAEADSIATFALDGGGTQDLSGDTLEVTLADLSFGGVTFDAVLLVVGSNDLDQVSSGLGVEGGSNPINAGEWLRFSLTIENTSGGTASFLGFDSLDFTFFSTKGEEALLSLDASASTTCDNFATAAAPDDDPFDLSDYAPAAFTLFGIDAFGEGGGTVSFRVDSIDAAFSTATPVPEPGSFLLVAAGGLVGLWRCRRT